MSKQFIYKQVLKEYEKNRDEAKRLLESRKRKIYKNIPRIEEIDFELTKTGINISKAVLHAKNNGEKQVLLNELKNKNENLIKEKENLMLENGYKIDYFNSVYKCEFCKDTGYIKNKKCRCFNQKLINKAYDMSNLKDILIYENFDTFDFRYYSDIKDEKEGVSPLENIKKIWTVCLNFVKNFDSKFENLVFYGSSGLGKTFLCNCIAKELLDAGKTVIYVTAFQLFKMIENERFNKTEEEESNEFLDMLNTVDLLIIDDLGTEFSTVLSSSELFNFINTRMLEKKATIISTNLSPQNMINQYSDRIISRIYGQYKILSFFGDDIRILKRTKG